jgi:hypothetical protein
MIALAGCMRLMAGARDELPINARANWELEDSAATGV